MEIGIAKERAASSKEVRIILLPPEVKKIVQAGHKVFVEKNAAIGIYINDNEYKAAGAAIVNQPQKIFNKQLVVKIKPPRTREFRLMKGNILFSMIHAEQNPHYVRQIRERNVKAVAMEEVKDSYGERLIECTAMTGSQGMLMAFHHSPKIPSECRVLILGYGHVATGAIRAANQLEAKVRIMRRHEYSNIEH